MTMHILWSSILILIVIGVRALLRKKISQRLMYALWLVVLIKLCLPMSLFNVDMPFLAKYTGGESEITETAPPTENDPIDEPVTNTPVVPSAPTYPSVPNTPTYPANPDASDERPGVSGDDIGSSTPAVDDKPNAGVTTPVLPSVPSQPTQPVQPVTPPTDSEQVIVPQVPVEKRTVDWAAVAKNVWIAGSVALALWFVGTAVIFVVRVRKNREYFCKVGKLRVYRSEEIGSPCLAGLPPAIYVTNEKMTREMLSMVLVHEYTHLRHLDPLWSLLRTAMVVIYWWNPLVWAAAILSKRDAEFACDETVANKLSSDQRMKYANLLVDSIPVKRHYAIGFGSASIKERLLMLTKQYKKHTIAAIIAVVIAIVAVGCAFIGPKETEAPLDTDISETDAPETEAPETDAPETDAPIVEPQKITPVTVLSNPGGLKFSTITIPQNWLSIYEFDSEHILLMTYNVETGERGRVTANTDIRFYLVNTVRGELVATLDYGRAEGYLTTRHYEQDALVLYDLGYNEETETYSVPAAIRIEYKNGKLIAQETEKSAFPYNEEKRVSSDGKYTVYSTGDDGYGHGGIDVLYPDGTTKRILTNVMLDDPGVTSLGGVTGYSPIQFIDNTRFLYHIGGWEWTQGYGIYNLATGEKTEFRNGYGAIGYADGYIYLREVSGYETVAWHKATLDGEIEKIASVNEEDGVLYIPNARKFKFGGAEWRDMYYASSYASTLDTSVLNTTIYSPDCETVLANVTYDCTDVTIYVISHGMTETAIVFAEEEVLPPQPMETVKVISNPGGLDVYTVTIPAQIENHSPHATFFRYDDRYVLCLTSNYHFDETIKGGVFSNLHLYVIDTANGTIIHSQSLDCTDIPNNFLYTSDGGTVLADLKHNDHGKLTAKCAHEIEIYDGTVIVSDTEIEYFPHYDSKVTSPDEKYSAYSVIDDPDYHGGIELRRIDGSVKRIYENYVILMEDGVSSDVYGCLAAYSPLGFIDEKHLVVLVSGYESAGTYEIYNVETGEAVYVSRPEYKTDENGEEYMVSYTPEAVIDGWLYLTEHRNYNHETYGEIYGAWKIDLAGNMVKLMQVDGNDDVLSLPRELYWSMYNDVWHAYNNKYNGWSLELEEYFESMDYRITKTIYSADFMPLLEIEYPYFRGTHRMDVYTYRFGGACTVITFTDGEPLPDTQTEASPVTVLSNPKGYSVQTVYIPAGGDGSATGYKYSDGMKLYMTKDNVTDETGYVKAYTNIKLYLVDMDHGRIVGECAIDGEYRLDNISYNTSGDGIVLRDVEFTHDKGYLVHGAFHILYSGGKLTATKIDADSYYLPEYANAYPQYDEPVRGNAENGIYIAYRTTDDGQGRGGIDLKAPDGTVKRILTNVVLDDAGGNLSDVTYYTPVGFIAANVYDGAARLVYNIGAYEGAGKGFGIYNVHTGEREEFIHMNYRAVDVWSNAIYFEEYKRTDEGYSESYRLWKRDRLGNMTLLWSTDPADGAAYHEGESFPSFKDGLWSFLSYPDMPVPDYLTRRSIYVKQEVRHGDNFDPIVTVRYPSIGSYTSNFGVSTMGQVTVVLPVPEDMIPPNVTTVEFETVDELITKFADEIDGFARGSYERQEFLNAVDEFINPEKHQGEMTKSRYAALSRMGAENFSATYDKRSGKMYLNFTITGEPVGTLKKGENTAEICESLYGIGVMCGDTSANNANEARSAVSKYLGWIGNNGLPDSSIGEELVFTDYIASCLNDLGQTPTRAAVIDYAERCFGINGYTPRNDQFDQNGNHVQLGYGLGNVTFIITNDTVKNGIHTVTVDFYNDSYYQEKYQTVNYRITKLQDGAWKFIDILPISDKATEFSTIDELIAAYGEEEILDRVLYDGAYSIEDLRFAVDSFLDPRKYHDQIGDIKYYNRVRLGIKDVSLTYDRDNGKIYLNFTAVGAPIGTLKLGRNTCAVQVGVRGVYVACGEWIAADTEAKITLERYLSSTGLYGLPDITKDHDKNGLTLYIIRILMDTGIVPTKDAIQDYARECFYLENFDPGDWPVVNGVYQEPAMGGLDFPYLIVDEVEEGVIHYVTAHFYTDYSYEVIEREVTFILYDLGVKKFRFEGATEWKINGTNITVDVDDLANTMSVVEGAEMYPAEEYTVYVTGLSTPVTLFMRRDSVYKIEAFGHYLETAEPHDMYGNCHHALFEVDGTIIFTWSYYSIGYNYIFTPKGCSQFDPAREDASFLLYLDYMGDFKYRFTNKNEADIQQSVMYYVTSYDEFYYEVGDASIVDGSIVLGNPTEYKTIGDVYSLDGMFAKGKEEGLYAEYETIEDLFAANKARREMSEHARNWDPEEFATEIAKKSGSIITAHGTPIGGWIHYYFPAILSSSKQITVYYTTDFGLTTYTTTAPLPEGIEFEYGKVVAAGGGAGSGECTFILRLENGDEVTFWWYMNFADEEVHEFGLFGEITRENVHHYGRTWDELLSLKSDIPLGFEPASYKTEIELQTGKEVLFWHKIFSNSVYLYFVPIERGAREFTVYAYKDYSMVINRNGEGLHELKLHLPDTVTFGDKTCDIVACDSIEPVWAGGGGGSGECQFVLRVTRGEDVTYISYNNFHYETDILDFRYAGAVPKEDLEYLIEAYPEIFGDVASH